MEAGYMPTWVGLVWSLQYARFWSSDPRNVSDLQLYDLDMMLRARLAMRGGLPAFLWLQLGGSLVRANVPVGPNLESSYIGPDAGVGAELVFGSVIISIGADYTALSSGPSGLRVMLFGGVGSR
jgi:hypothetical protein